MTQPSVANPKKVGIEIAKFVAFWVNSTEKSTLLV